MAVETFDRAERCIGKTIYPIHIYIILLIPHITIFEMIFVRDSVMATDANSSDQERARSCRVIPAHVQRHHGAQATHRVGGFQRR